MAKKVFLVGGAVRDALMGLTPRERDFVVVGATVEQMLKEGYVQVGKDFPVFLHPKTKEEYALARTERKTGTGYKGFAVHAEPSVTLEEDLKRRDLTINAIAQAKDGRLLDPFGGSKDIEQKVLRHVSDAFEEDPLRVVRLARFQSRFADFHVDAQTHTMCKRMVQSGELASLTPERVWQEWMKAASTPRPDLFVKTLVDFGAWSVLFKGFRQGEKDMQWLSRAMGRLPFEHFFAVFGHYLSDDEYDVALQGIAMPKQVKALGQLSHQIWYFYRCVLTKSTDTKYTMRVSDAQWLLDALYRWDVFRRMERFVDACAVISHASGDSGFVQSSNTWMQYARVLVEIDFQSLDTKALQGHDIKTALYRKRLQLLATSMNNATD